jgi:glucose-1-phosphate cytidylyltransferase
VKAVILAGGLGTRISEETAVRPKPMVEVGGKPILWHVMNTYAAFGVTEFIICAGYRAYMIKEYFANYVLHNADIRVDMRAREVTYLRESAEHWCVTIVDTGEATETGGRLKRVARYLDPHEPFYFTYGDGVGNVDIDALTRAHRVAGLPATVTAVQPPGRFGELRLDGVNVAGFAEKPQDGGWINGGFFVLEPAVIDLIAGDHTSWEHDVLGQLAADRALNVYLHRDFWLPMDTLRDKMRLEELWASGKAPWRVRTPLARRPFRGERTKPLTDRRRLAAVSLAERAAARDASLQTP